MRPKHLATLCLAAVLATTAVASDSLQSVNEQTVHYKSGAAAVQATLFAPTKPGKHPGVVFLHEGSQGLTVPFKARCRDLAQSGLVVLAPHYKGTGGPEVTEPLLAEVEAAREYLASHFAVREGKVGILGTGQGGYLAVQSAICDPAAWRCVVQAGGAIDVPSCSKNIRSAVYIQHGERDLHTRLADARWLNAELKRAGGSSQLREYTMLDHGMWFWEDRGYDTDQIAQAKWAWEDLTNYLTRAMGASATGTMAR